MRLPQFSIPEGYKDQFDYLEKQAWEGLKRLKWDSSEPHIEALKKELRDIRVAYENNGYDFATYFLIVQDYIKYAKDNNIMVGFGRGSGYASVLLRCLDICSGPDPLRYGLIWERFLGFDDLQFIKESDFGFEDDIVGISELTSSEEDEEEILVE